MFATYRQGGFVVTASGPASPLLVTNGYTLNIIHVHLQLQHSCVSRKAEVERALRLELDMDGKSLVRTL